MNLCNLHSMLKSKLQLMPYRHLKLQDKFVLETNTHFTFGIFYTFAVSYSMQSKIVQIDIH